jgi:hypothetical protein
MAEAMRAPAASATGSTNGGAPAPIVIDLGRKNRKQVKRLRKGRGKLLDKVAGVIDGMRATGALQPNAQTVIVVVREKEERGLLW